jgi:ABC-2 type transport system permease protein
MNALILLTIANIKSFVRDRAALFWTLAFPLIFIFLFGAIFSGGNNDRTIGFGDLDRSAA